MASALLGAVVCFSLAATSLYIAIGGEELQGGIPFVPRAFNQAVGRLMVGGGAVLTAALGAYALYEAVTLLRTKNADVRPPN